MSRAKCVFILLLLDFQFVIPQELTNSLQDLVKGTKPPLVVVLNTKQRQGTIYDLAETGVSSEESDEGAYFLYHLLRTTEENENLDPEAARTFEKTKDILGEALRSRCNRYERCVKRCVKKVYVCKVTCKREYDVYEVCERITVCHSCGNGGKTMPPYWLL